MKTAGEWKRKLLGSTIHVSDIKQIQLDAMKEGMRRAAKIVLLAKTTYQYKECGKDAEMHAQLTGECDMINKNKQDILTAAEQLTEKDL